MENANITIRSRPQDTPGLRRISKGMDTHTQELSPYLSEADIAARLGVAPKTLRNWRALETGRPYLKLGGSVIRYHLGEVDAWALTQRRAA
jgi:hypothetical protein